MATFKGAAREAQRAALLMKQREKERQELELQKRKLEAEMRVGEMSTKFAVHYDAIEYQLKNNTIGLVTLDEMKARQKAYLTQREKELALGNSKGLSHKSENSTLEKKNKLQPSLLSFSEEEDVEDEIKPSISAVQNSESPEKVKVVLHFRSLKMVCRLNKISSQKF
ncbi:Protein fam50a, variant 2 [Schistosoma haematobium]|uniref:Protein fam50a, variant 2 n=1 Tax=Schistosoma haematobium TaxID=6185 RepID=A0A922IRP8_SCHHA|nr:Protein fam50a, variant 2 [Schistosoma haematobium]KAH9584759.1 Protein fam50a, variant 2 [Schistosoma haematobium]